MGRRLSFITSICLCFVFSTLHNSIFVLSQRGGVRIHPEFVPEPPSQVPTAGALGGTNARLTGTDSGGKPQPFLDVNQDAYDVVTLKPLLLSLASDINNLYEQVTQESTSIDLATLSVPPDAAEVGCSIYSAYQTYCQVGSLYPIGTVGNIVLVPATSDVFASCACYSSTYWVPDLYDNAVWACNAISSDSTDFTAWVTTYTNTPTGFCNWHNPRAAPFAYGLSTAAAAVTTPAAATSTPAPSPATTAAAPASPTAGSSASTVMMKGLGGIGRVRWALIGVIAIVIALA